MPATISPRAFDDRDPAAAIVDLGGETMGTSWHVRFVRPAGLTVDAVRSAIEHRLDGLVAEMSHWAPASQLSRFNRAAAGSWTSLPSDFAHVMDYGLAIARTTGGAFDPAIGRLVDIWGFGPVPVQAPPPADAIGAALAVSGWERLSFSPADRRLRQPGGLALDLSGIAKGHAVDVVADLLGGLGVGNSLVEIGGELAGRGIRPDGDPWWVDLEVPPGANVTPLRIALHDLAVATSGSYRRGDHTLDPRTGRPATSGALSVSVIHATALAADAWATALTVLAPDDGVGLATRQGIAARLITSIGGVTRERLTPALEAMLADD